MCLDTSPLVVANSLHYLEKTLSFDIFKYRGQLTQHLNISQKTIQYATSYGLRRPVIFLHLDGTVYELFGPEPAALHTHTVLRFLQLLSMSGDIFFSILGSVISSAPLSEKSVLQISERCCSLPSDLMPSKNSTFFKLLHLPKFLDPIISSAGEIAILSNALPWKAAPLNVFLKIYSSVPSISSPSFN